jgi:hypothetical protein
MQQKADENNTRKGAETLPLGAKKLAQSWKHPPIGWIVLGLVVLSWIAFVLMTNGIAFLIHH